MKAYVWIEENGSGKVGSSDYHPVFRMAAGLPNILDPTEIIHHYYPSCFYAPSDWGKTLDEIYQRLIAWVEKHGRRLILAGKEEPVIMIHEGGRDYPHTETELRLMKAFNTDKYGYFYPTC